MKKIRLDIDELDVQSFATVHPDGARGTVQGADSAPSYEQSYEGTCYQWVEGCGVRENPTRDCITFDLSCTCQPGQFPC
ncbi:MAG: hypothetical protein ACJ8GN_12220 [Longimicrobiaceae bacterium]